MWRRGGRVSWLSLKTKVDGLSVIWPKNHWDSLSRFDLKIGALGFHDLDLKISRYDFMIWVSKQPRRLIGLGIKTKQDTVYRLHHRTDGRMKIVWGTR
jgi:hypothetical protein